MPLFLASLIGALVSAAGTFVGRALLSLGIGYAVFSGVDTSIYWARDFVLAKFSGLPATVLAVASAMKLGSAVSILTSALVARLTLNGLSSGVIKKFVLK